MAPISRHTRSQPILGAKLFRTNKEVEVNFPVKVNKEKLGQVMQSLQGDWEIQSGTYVAGGNARMALTTEQLLDGEKHPLRFTIHGNQWLGHSTISCGAPESELGLALCDGVAELMIDESSAAPCLTLVRFQDGKKRSYTCLYQVCQSLKPHPSSLFKKRSTKLCVIEITALYPG